MARYMQGQKCSRLMQMNNIDIGKMTQVLQRIYAGFNNCEIVDRL